MEEAKGKRERSAGRGPRMNPSNLSKKGKRAVESEKVELSLGLSLNGRFGAEPEMKLLKRSSSVLNLGSEAGNGGGEQEVGATTGEEPAPLVRAHSLPSETDELRRRKDLQLQAREKRMEKLKMKDKEGVSGGRSETSEEDDVIIVGVKRADGTVEGTVAGVRRANNTGYLHNYETWFQAQAQGSAINGSPKASDPKGPSQTPMQKMKPVPARGPRVLPEEVVQVPPIRGAGIDGKPLSPDMFNIPFVATRVSQANRARVEGFLYRYQTGEDVKIVCNCHGSFFTPAEFVKHGGGGAADIAQPLKNIIVYPL